MTELSPTAQAGAGGGRPWLRDRVRGGRRADGGGCRPGQEGERASNTPMSVEWGGGGGSGHLEPLEWHVTCIHHA